MAEHLDLLRVAGVAVAVVVLLFVTGSVAGVIAVVLALVVYELALTTYGAGIPRELDEPADGKRRDPERPATRRTRPPDPARAACRVRRPLTASASARPRARVVAVLARRARHAPPPPSVPPAQSPVGRPAVLSPWCLAPPPPPPPAY